jgi:hypothetical protein
VLLQNPLGDSATLQALHAGVCVPGIQDHSGSAEIQRVDSSVYVAFAFTHRTVAEHVRDDAPRHFLATHPTSDRIARISGTAFCLDHRRFAGQSRSGFLIKARDKGAGLHRMRGLVAAEGAGEIIFDFLLGVAAVLIAELHADAGGTLSLRPLGGHPDHPAGDRKFLLFAHQV